MIHSDNDNIQIKHRIYRSLGTVLCLFTVAVVFSAPAIHAQTRSESDVVVPFEQLLRRPLEIRPELKGVHPRLFVTASQIKDLREKSKGASRDLWRATLNDIETLRRPVPDPRDEDLYKSGLDERKPGSISQYNHAFQIAETSFAYVIEQDEKYLAAAKKWALAACEMPIWGYTYNKPNVDLPPAHLLYAVAFSYDLLYDKYTPSEREIIRNKLVKQGRLMYEYFKYKPGKKYTYTQNHTWIPMAGLAIAAYVLMDEVDEAKQWAQLSRAIYDRTMQAFGTDGFFYESFHYFGFAFRWAIRYFDAHKQITGEDLYARMKPKFAGMKYFVMHSILPDGKNVFDFGDIGDGSLNRNGTSKRESIYGEYDILHRLAAVYQDREAQAVADFVRDSTKLEDREPMWAFINRDEKLKAAPLSDLPLQYRFEDNDTAYWRSDWTKNATAFAFRCSPPEGHHAAKLAAKIPDWRQNTGHAHPDANSFIIWANGKYLTGDTGYLGIKQTDDHNTILVNGRGQEKDGVYEMFKDVPNERLDKIKIAEYAATSKYFYARGEAASGYYADLGLKKFDRHFLYVAPDYFVVWDELETEKPSKFTFMLNADREAKVNDNYTDLLNQTQLLRIFRVNPTEAKSEIVGQSIQARGLPGSVDKGDTERRGVQLQTTNAAPASKVEFLHFLFPSDARATAFPKVAKAENGLIVKWPNGDIDSIVLAKTTGSKATFQVVRKSADGKSKRLVWQSPADVKLD